MIEFWTLLIVLGPSYTAVCIISLGPCIIMGRQKNYLPRPDSSKEVKLGTTRKKQNSLAFVRSAMQIVEPELWFRLFCSRVKNANCSSR